MDAQSICHNRSQLIIPQEHHRTFVCVYNWICAAEVRQPHNPACSSHLCLPTAPKAPNVWPQETRSKGNTARRAVSVLSSSLACPVKRPVKKNASSLDKLQRWIIFFVSILLPPRFLESGATERNLKKIIPLSEVPRLEKLGLWLCMHHFGKVFVVLHDRLLQHQNIWGLIPSSTPEDTVKCTFKTQIHCEVSEKIFTWYDPNLSLNAVRKFWWSLWSAIIVQHLPPLFLAW